MKRLLFFLSVFILISVNTYGQNTYIGKIIEMPNPCLTIPCLPCLVFGLGINLEEHVLSFNSHWFRCGNRLIIEEIEYFSGDEVEITGEISVKQDSLLNEYTELEIETIKKLSSNIKSSLLSKNIVYYDNTNQMIVINEDLQSQSLAFELIDMQGKVILQKTGINNSISIVNLPNGVYVYRLLEKDQIICWGKIIK
jgi:hypothetical protein